MFKLSNLGNYKVERAEDYAWAKSTGEDLTYYEIIRVKGSRPAPCFTVPSHLYKYGEKTLAIYLKDHKNYWRPLSELLGQEIDISDDEALYKFPIDKLPEVSKIVKFVMKKGSRNLSKKFIQAREKTQFKHGDIVKQNHKKIIESASSGIITLENFRGDKI